MWLLDTVALSELYKPRSHPGFATWFEQQSYSDIHTSVLCLGEIRRGAIMLPDRTRGEEIERWLIEGLGKLLEGRALPITDQISQAWGRLGARGKQEPVDALIGATAAVHGLTVVTRNVRHFDGLGAPVLNPWT